MARTKKMYKYVQVKERKCYPHCGGEGWHYKTVRRLVGEEVVTG